MLLVGLAFFVFWLLVEIFAVTLVKAALVTAIVFIVLGILTEGLPSFKK
jgi:hypothetical protein